MRDLFIITYNCVGMDNYLKIKSIFLKNEFTKPDENTTRKIWANFPVNIDAKIQNETLANQVQQHIKKKKKTYTMNK